MEEERKSLDELLDDQQAEATVEEPQVEETPPEPVNDRPRDEHGRFAAKTGVEDDTAPPAGLPREEFAGLKDERRKRQEAEQQIAALQQQLQAAQNPPAPPPSIWEDEGAWQQQFGGQVVQAATHQASLNATLNMSEMMASRDHEDFDEKKSLFLEMVQQNPQLRDVAMQDRHPWEKAYQIANNHKTMEELQATSIDDLRAKIRAELEAEMTGQQPPIRKVPPTLSTERNAGARSGPAWAGPQSLSDLLR